MLRKTEKQKKKLPGWMIFPILAAVLLICFGISKLVSSGKGASELQVVTVKKGDVKQTYNTSGTVESGKVKVFYSPVNAPVLTCNAEAGMAVKAGDMLVTFDTTNLERDNRQSELNELSAKYTNQDAREQSARAEKASAQAGQQAAAAKQNLKSQIQEKEKEVSTLKQQAEASSGAASQNAAQIAQIQGKMQENLNSQSIQRAAKENAERQLANLSSSAADYEQKSQELIKAAEEATNNMSTLEQEYRSLEQQLGQIGNTDVSGILKQYAAASQELETLKASLTELENSGSTMADTGLTGGQAGNMRVTENLAELASLTTEELLNKGKEGIKAEFDGIIADVKATPGSLASQGVELLTLVSNQDVYVELKVAANDFDNLSTGCKADIKIGKKTYKGKLDSIDKIALPNEKGNPVIGARVTIENPDEDIYIGVGAKVSMTVAEKKNVLYVPGEVINTSTDGDFVYVIRDGVVKKQAVELGVVSGSKAEIINGLKEGDEVVSDVNGNLKEGMKASAAKEQ